MPETYEIMNSCGAVIANFIWGSVTCGEIAPHTFIYEGVEYHSCDEHLPQGEKQ